jgi:hypothetical protein
MESGVGVYNTNTVNGLEKEKIIDLSTLTITEYSTRICSY